MKKAVVVLAAASVAIIVNAGKPDSFFEANVEALADDEAGSDCHYVNGYTQFGDRDGGAYDCCAVWRDKRPSSDEHCR